MSEKKLSAERLYDEMDVFANRNRSFRTKESNEIEYTIKETLNFANISNTFSQVGDFDNDALIVEHTFGAKRAGGEKAHDMITHFFGSTAIVLTAVSIQDDILARIPNLELEEGAVVSKRQIVSYFLSKASKLYLSVNHSAEYFDEEGEILQLASSEPVYDEEPTYVFAKYASGYDDEEEVEEDSEPNQGIILQQMYESTVHRLNTEKIKLDKPEDYLDIFRLPLSEHATEMEEHMFLADLKIAAFSFRSIKRLLLDDFKPQK